MIKKFAKQAVSRILESKLFKTKNNAQLMEFFTPGGDEVFIDREEYRTKVLPYNLQENWNNPDELYNQIHGALLDEFIEEIMEPSSRLLEIDPTPERSHTLRSIVLMKNGKTIAARKVS